MPAQLRPLYCTSSRMLTQSMKNTTQLTNRIPHKMDDLYATDTVLIKLCPTVSPAPSVDRASMQPLRPIVFAAALKLETPQLFLHSLDAICLRQAEKVARLLPRYEGCTILDYQSDRFFVWEGFDDMGAVPGISIPGLNFYEIRNQLDLLAKRGYRDWIQVHIVLRVQLEEDGENTRSEDIEGEGKKLEVGGEGGWGDYGMS